MLTQTEIAVLGQVVDQMVDAVLLRFSEIRALFGERFHAEMQEVSSQAKWNGKDYGGYRSQGIKDDFAGGYQESVPSNLLYSLGMSAGLMPDLSPGYIFKSKACFLVLAKAMHRDSDLDLYIRSVIAAAEKVGRGRDYEKYDRPIIEFIKSLIG